MHNLYCDADGQSHFRDIEIELSEPMLGGVLSKPQAVSTLMFRQIPDGEARVLDAGEVMLIEDTTSSWTVRTRRASWRTPGRDAR